MPLTPEERTHLLSHRLTAVEVRMTLAGFLHHGLSQRHGVTNVSARDLFDAISLYVDGVDKLLPVAERLHDSGFRPSGWECRHGKADKEED